MNGSTDFPGRARRRFPQWAPAALVVTGFSVVTVLSSCILVRGRTGDQIVFPLSAHAGLLADCDRCHEDVATDDVTPATRRSLERRCLECHEERAQDCGYCHTDVASAGVFPDKERHLAFSHATHLIRTQGDCSQCHPRAHSGATDPLAKEHPTWIPAHEECFSCHQMQGFYDRLECRNCHEELFRYGLKPYERFAHTADWLEQGHAAFLRDPGREETCKQCHERRFCDDCHSDPEVLRLWERSPEKVSRTFIHAGDYIHRHMWEARADGASCQRCHATSYCKDCHDARGLTEPTAALRRDGFRFHGPGVLVRGSKDFHGDAARRDILSCAACHTEGTAGNCVSCHSVGAFGGNPHPPGFQSRLSRTGAPVCRLCH